MKKEETIDLGEYKVEVVYSGNGHLIITVLDEIGEIIESIEIANEGDS